MVTKDQPQRGEVWVAIMNGVQDCAISREERWYRIPVDSAPKVWPPSWLAFSQTKGFGDERYAVDYYGRVRGIRVVQGHELLSSELPNPRSDRLCCQLHLEELEPHPEPIGSMRWRRTVFIPTTWEKFNWLWKSTISFMKALWGTGSAQRFSVGRSQPSGNGH